MEEKLQLAINYLNTVNAEISWTFNE
jgi:hypothetical protein